MCNHMLEGKSIFVNHIQLIFLLVFCCCCVCLTFLAVLRNASDYILYHFAHAGGISRWLFLDFLSFVLDFLVRNASDYILYHCAHAGWSLLQPGHDSNLLEHITTGTHRKRYRPEEWHAHHRDLHAFQPWYFENGIWFMK